MAWYQDLDDPKARDEAGYIVREFAEHKIDIDGVASAGGGVAFMYAHDQLLAREQYLEHIQEVLGRRARAVVARRVIRDIVLLNIVPIDNGERSAESNDSAPQGNDSAPQGANSAPQGNDGNPEGTDGHADGITRSPEPALLGFLREIDAALGPGIVTPNHVVTVAGDPSPCPATEPQEVYGDPGPYPAVCPGTGGEKVRIYIADTGLLASSCSWLDGVQGDADPRVLADGTICPYAGHGTFVAGVVRCLAPGAEIIVENVFNIAGSALEADFVPKLNAGFGYGAEIFHLTVASPTRCNLPLLAFEAWMESLRQYKGVVCVVAAGNNDSRLPCWPAAFPGMISVGALAADWRSRAYFSNYGGWVDVYAPGQNLINAFATGTYDCHVAPYAGQKRTFSGMAQWSGTSFSTPVVTGLIAARMARCGESGQEAAAALLARARAEAIPGVGPVLLPCCDDDECRGGGCGCSGGGCSGGCGGGGCGGGGCGRGARRSCRS
jgi:subtilisin family serine protease